MADVFWALSSPLKNPLPCFDGLSIPSLIINDFFRSP